MTIKIYAININQNLLPAMWQRWREMAKCKQKEREVWSEECDRVNCWSEQPKCTDPKAEARGKMIKLLLILESTTQINIVFIEK